MPQSLFIFAMKTGNAVLAFLLSLLVARFVGVEGFGVYSVVMALIAIFSVLATAGLESLALKDVAVAAGKADRQAVATLSNVSTGVAGLTSLSISVVTLLIYSAAHYLGGFERYTPWIAVVFALTLPLATLNRHISFVQLAKGDALSQFPSMIVIPATAIALVSLAIYCFDFRGVEWILSSVALANLCALVIYLRRSDYRWAYTRFREIAEWLKKARHFFLLNIAQVVTANTGLVMLGVLADSKETGLFSAALKISSVVLFLLYSSNMALMPTIADYYHNDKRDLMQSKLLRMNQFSFAFAVLMLFILYFFGERILALFGSEFQAGSNLLVILVAGMAVCAVANAAGPLLSMTGHIKQIALLSACMTLFSVAAHYVLIRWLDAYGAAIATSLTLVIQNGIAVIMIYRYMKINPTLFAAGRHGSST